MRGRRVLVAAGLVERGGRVLLAKRLEGDERGGLWEFPGGAVEGGEGLEACLARELREELGIEVEVGEEVASLSHDYGDVEVELHLLRARILRGEPRPLGCAEVRWVTPAEAARLPLAPADRRLLSLLGGDVPPSSSSPR
ncbi:(deoxy)nucleoside triphosphate pyrophosphohydrolase [Candidatus Bipolaricaulota sp. J31]